MNDSFKKPAEDRTTVAVLTFPTGQIIVKNGDEVVRYSDGSFVVMHTDGSVSAVSATGSVTRKMRGDEQ